MQDADSRYNEELEDEEFEAYCVRCKHTVVIQDPTPVWTKRGAPGMRGVCEICGSTVFRMGRTDAHRGMVQPDVSQFRGISGGTRGRGGRQARHAAYINYAPQDAELAGRLAEDLTRMGFPAWFEEAPGMSRINWAGGVHPALEECSHMVVVLSEAALRSTSVERGWRYFREQRKPTVIVQIEAVEVPDDLRRSPRFDFSQEYRSAFRAMFQTLAG